MWWSWWDRKSNLTLSLSMLATPSKATSLKPSKDEPVDQWCLALIINTMYGFGTNFTLRIWLLTLKRYVARAVTQFKRAVSPDGNIKNKNETHSCLDLHHLERGGIKISVIGMDTPMTEVFAQGTNRLKASAFTNPTLEVKKIVKENWW